MFFKPKRKPKILCVSDSASIDSFQNTLSQYSKKFEIVFIVDDKDLLKYKNDKNQIINTQYIVTNDFTRIQQLNIMTIYLGKYIDTMINRSNVYLVNTFEEINEVLNFFIKNKI